MSVMLSLFTFATSSGQVGCGVSDSCTNTWNHLLFVSCSVLCFCVQKGWHLPSSVVGANSIMSNIAPQCDSVQEVQWHLAKCGTWALISVMQMCLLSAFNKYLFWQRTKYTVSHKKNTGVFLAVIWASIVQFLQRAQLHCKRCISYGNSVRLSVCPSVCHTPVLCQNDGT